MKHYFFILSVFLLAATIGCSQSNDESYLIKVYDGEYDEIGASTGYKNQQGEIVIPKGKYYYCFTDTLKDYAVVLDKNQKCIAIDKKDNILYEVFWYDNGPDFISEGLFRMLKDGKIGYADTKGKIVIEPKYECAESFQDGKAKVALKCTKTKMDEYTMVESKEWVYINKKGEVIEKIKETPKAQSSETLQGKFRSIKGVMVDLSCYCFNAGYLTTDQGEEIAICFKDDDIQISCTKIEVKGNYEKVKNEPEKTSPCKAGEKTIFMVDSYECK